MVINFVFLAGKGFDTLPGLSFSSRPEHKAVIKPIVAHEQITGEFFIIEIGLCELRQVVAFFHNRFGRQNLLHRHTALDTRLGSP